MHLLFLLMFLIQTQAQSTIQLGVTSWGDVTIGNQPNGLLSSCGTGNPWSGDPTALGAIDGSYVTNVLSTITCSDFIEANFSSATIPALSTINGLSLSITLRITKNSGNGAAKVTASVIALSKNGVLSSNLGGNSYSNFNSNLTYGGSSNLWGYSSWSISDLSAVEAWIYYTINSGNFTIDIDYVQLTVYYTPPSTTQQQTTQQQTTQQQTTQESTTQESTTQQQQTTQQTTQQATTQIQTTQQQTTQQQATTQQATTQQQTSQQTTAQQFTTDEQTTVQQQITAQITGVQTTEIESSTSQASSGFSTTGGSLGVTSKNTKSNVVPIIVGVVIGGVILLAFILCLVLFLLARRKSKREKEEDPKTTHSVSQIFQVMNEHELKRRASQQSSAQEKSDDEASEKTNPPTTKLTAQPEPTPPPKKTDGKESGEEEVSSDELSGVFEEILQTIDKEE